MSILRAIQSKHDFQTKNEFPFTLPTIRTFEKLDLSADVTFFVGENGSGKSTLLEGIASLIEAETIGAESIQSDGSYDPARRLGNALRPVWNRRTNQTMFLRGEDYLGYARRLHSELDFAKQNLKTDPSWAFDAAGVASQIRGISNTGQVDLHAQSHGESFLAFFRGRFRPSCVFLLDEPETALSPQNQLVMIAMLRELTLQDAQFIIATHSPILMAYPGARIYTFDEQPIQEIPFQDTEHVWLTRNFLNDPGRFLKNMGFDEQQN